MAKRVLLVGGAGFIGTHLADALAAAGHIPIIYDIKRPHRDKYRCIRGDARHPDHLRRIAYDSAGFIGTIDFIFHLAARLGVAHTVADPAGVARHNLRCTTTVADVCEDYNLRGIFTSTSEVYGHPQRLPMDEDSPVVLSGEGRWAYAAAKLVEEHIACAAMRVVRLFNIVGPGQSEESGHVLPNFARQALLRQNLTIHGDGQQTRSFMDVRDCARTLVHLMDRNFYTVNVGVAQEYSINAMARDVATLAGWDSPRFSYVNTGWDDCRRRVPDLTRLHSLGAPAPTIPLTQTIVDLVNSIRVDLGMEVSHGAAQSPR